MPDCPAVLPATHLPTQALVLPTTVSYEVQLTVILISKLRPLQ